MQATLDLKAKKGERVCVMCRTGSEEGEGDHLPSPMPQPSSRRSLTLVFSRGAGWVTWCRARARVDHLLAGGGPPGDGQRGSRLQVMRRRYPFPHPSARSGGGCVQSPCQAGQTLRDPAQRQTHQSRTAPNQCNQSTVVAVLPTGRIHSPGWTLAAPARGWPGTWGSVARTQHRG